MTADEAGTWTVVRPVRSGRYKVRQYGHAAWSGDVGVNEGECLIQVGEDAFFEFEEFLFDGHRGRWSMNGFSGEFFGPLEPPV